MLVDHGIAAVPLLLYRLQGVLGLTPQETWFISFVLSYKWDERDPYPSLKEISQLSGVPKATLVMYKNSLVKKGLLRIRQRRSRGGRSLSHAYDFTPLFRRMEKIIEELKTQADSEQKEGEGQYTDPRGSAGRPEEKEYKKKRIRKPPSISPPKGGRAAPRGHRGPLGAGEGEEDNRAVCSSCNREVQAEAIIDGICAACHLLKKRLVLGEGEGEGEGKGESDET